MGVVSKDEKKVLDQFMKENHLDEDSVLYRYTSRKYLSEKNGDLFLNAKSKPQDMVIDRYHGHWEVFIGSEIGQGISFLSLKEVEYQNNDRVCVELKVSDALQQGGLIYEVTSLPTYLKAYFCTLPSGMVKVSFSQG